MTAIYWLIVVVLVWICPPSPAAAGAFDWKFAGWDGGGCYPNIEFDPHVMGRLFLASDVAGIWRSDNNGESWGFATKGLSTMLVAQIAVSPTRPSVVYVATRKGIFYSKNSGDFWSEANNLDGRISFERPTSYRSISVSPERSESLCVGTATGEVFCSNNLGLTWDNIPQPRIAAVTSPIVAVHYMPDASGLLVARENGILLYNFASQAWSSPVPAVVRVTDVATTKNGFVSAADGELWQSDTSGVRWHKIESRHPGKLYRLEPAPATGRLFAAWNDGWNGGVLVSTNEGKSWEVIGKVLKPDLSRNPTRRWANSGGRVASLKVSPFDPNIIMRTDWWGVWRSDDQGQTWSEKISGAPNTVGSDLRFAKDGTLFSATMDDGLLRSRDMGRSYEALLPSSGYQRDVNGHIWRVDFLDNRRIIATSSPWNLKINQVLLSDDDGRTFRPSRSGLPEGRPKSNTLWGEGYPRALAVNPHDRRSVYLGIDGDDGGGLFISKDGGETWDRSLGQPSSLRIYNGLAIDTVRPEIIYWGAVGKQGGIYRSIDSGRSWRAALQGSRAIFDIHVGRDEFIYATGESHGAAVFVSRDHGETWTLLGKFSSHKTAKAITSSPENPQILAVGTVSWSNGAPESVYLTLNGGKEWIDVTGNLPPGPGAAALTFSPNGHDLYVSRYGGGIYRLDVGSLAR